MTSCDLPVAGNRSNTEYECRLSPVPNENHSEPEVERCASRESSCDAGHCQLSVNELGLDTFSCPQTVNKVEIEVNGELDSNQMTSPHATAADMAASTVNDADRFDTVRATCDVNDDAGPADL